jgi:hypothetical protein
LIFFQPRRMYLQWYLHGFVEFTTKNRNKFMLLSYCLFYLDFCVSLFNVAMINLFIKTFFQKLLSLASWTLQFLVFVLHEMKFIKLIRSIKIPSNYQHEKSALLQSKKNFLLVCFLPLWITTSAQPLLMEEKTFD